MTESGLVSIILPARNEQAAIGRTLRSLPQSTLRVLGYDTEVIVLDGNSTDDTARIARQHGATVIPDQRPGKGYAVRDARPRLRGQYVVMLDADGTYAPDAIPRILSPLSHNEADIVLGHRRRLPGSMTSLHFVGNKSLSLFASFLYARICRDLCTGMWGLRRDVLTALPLRSRRFGLEAELFSLATRMRFRLAHVRVDYLPRVGPNNLSFGHDGLRIVRRLMRSRLAPLPPVPETLRGRPTPHEAPRDVETPGLAAAGREAHA